MGRKMMTEHDSIVAQAFNEESPDIPNATPAEGHGATGGKEDTYTEQTTRNSHHHER